MLAFYEMHNGFDFGALRLHPMSKWKSAKGWWRYQGGGALEDPRPLDGTIIGQYVTKSRKFSFHQSQIILSEDGSTYHLLTWGGPVGEIGESLEDLLDWVSERI